MTSPHALPLWTSRGEKSFLVSAALRGVDLLRRPIEASGVDFVRFRSILELKLRLDVRRASRKDEGSFGLGLLLLLAIGWLAGALPGFVAFLEPPPAAWMATVQSVNISLVAMVMLLQYGPMLVETTDIGVIAPRPVDDRTLFAARVAHILVYAGLLSASIAFWPVILGMLKYPAWAVLVVVPVACALSTLLTVGAIAGFYALVLRVWGPVRFQRVALAMQIVLTVLVMGGMQFLPRIVPWEKVAEVLERPGPLHYLLPPMHFGGLFDVVLGNSSAHALVLAALAVLLPIAAGALALHLASRHFLAGITGGEAGQVERKPTWGAGFFRRLGRVVTGSAQERAAYELALCLSRRDRVFLRAAIPQLVGFAFMILAISLPFRGRRHGPDVPIGGFALYFAAAVFPGVLEMARHSEFPTARWIYHLFPVRNPGTLLAGGVKAILVSVILPAALALAAILAAVGPARRIPDVVLSLELVLALVLVGLPFLGRDLLFTREHRPGQLNVRMLIVMVCTMACAGAAAGVHVLVRLHPIAQAGLMVALVPTLWLLFRRLSRLDADLPPP